MITSQKKSDSKDKELLKNVKAEADMDAMIKLTNMEDIKDFYTYTEDCIKCIIKLAVPNESEIEPLKFNLPDNIIKELKTKKLAVFDLDETLVHCEIKNPEKGQVKIKVTVPNGSQCTVNNIIDI